MIPALAILAILLAAIGLVYIGAYRRENRPDRILGLLYHRLVSEKEYASCPPTEKLFSMTEARFREQMEYLKHEGYTAVTLEQVVDYVREGRGLPPKPVMVSFDDGCISVYERAYAIMRELDIPGTVFVTTDPQSWVFTLGSNTQRRLTPEEMRELDANGIAVESHGVSHGAMEAMSREEITRELGDSKRELEEILGREVPYFSVPLNWYGPRVREVAEAVGYRAVCTSDNGTIHGGSDLFHLRRFIIEGTFPLAEFVRNLQPGTIVLRRVINLLKRTPARILGPRIWMPLRRRLFASFLGRYFALRYYKRLLAFGAVVALIAVVLAIWLLTGS
jgi:peptidoglycan/xylan/chitin deacetylase (PgdA/CDA1 family)